MQKCTAADVAQYLSSYGWDFQSDSAMSWSTGWGAKGRFHPLKIMLSDNLVKFELRPFINMRLEWGQFGDLERYFLELNQELQIAKLALDNDGHLVLLAQALRSGFSFEQFKHLIGILGYYADSLHAEIGGKLSEFGYSSLNATELLT